MTTLHLRNSVSRSPVRLGFLLIPLLLACFALLPTVQAVVPAPDGAYPGFNTAEGGPTALGQAVPGVWNTAIGQFALNLDVTGGTGNTAVGLNALRANTLGDFNSALGVNALRFNSTGSNNTGLGYQALFVNTGSSNTAVGVNALSHNTTGFQNAALGQGALGANIDGAFNTALGFQALASNNNDDNTAVGSQALVSNTGGFNTAVGNQALFRNTGSASGAGSFNTAVGYRALVHNTVGFSNTAIGENALFNNTGADNTALGLGAGSDVTTANHVICIGAFVGGANTNNSCYIGEIWNQPGGSQAVYVNSEGKLGYQVSSRRFKDQVKPMDQASEVIYSLEPVSFRYKPEIEPTRPLGFGLVAEDVAQLNPDLVTQDQNGEPY